MNVLLAKNFDVDNLKYSELKVMKSGAKSIYLNYKGAKVNLQTPILNIPYGVNDNTQFINKDEARKDEERKYDITVSFKGRGLGFTARDCLDFAEFCLMHGCWRECVLQTMDHCTG